MQQVLRKREENTRFASPRNHLGLKCLILVCFVGAVLRDYLIFALSAKDLIRNLLQPDVSKRLTATEALKHEVSLLFISVTTVLKFVLSSGLAWIYQAINQEQQRQTARMEWKAMV